MEGVPQPCDRCANFYFKIRSAADANSPVTAACVDQHKIPTDGKCRFLVTDDGWCREKGDL